MDEDDKWVFLLELKAFPGEDPETTRMVMVDLNEEDDRGDIEPMRDTVSGELCCLVGKEDETDNYERRHIAKVWQYDEDNRFNDKFPMYRQVSLADFVRCLLDTNLLFDGFTGAEVVRLKQIYGV